MVIYGVAFDRIEQSELLEKLEEEYGFDYSTCKGDIQIVTGYSVGCYDPEMAVLGIELTNDSPLFNPTDLLNMVERAQTELNALIGQGKVTKLIEVAATEKMGEPKLLIFDETDD